MQPGAGLLNPDEINQLTLDYQPGHDEWQIARVMIGRAGTPWGQYKQCLAEIVTRCEAIRADVETADRIAVDVAQAHAVCARLTEVGSGKHLAARTQAEQGEAAIAALKRSIMARRRECGFLVVLARHLRDTLESRTEFPVPEATRRELDRELWAFRALDRVASDLRFRGGLTDASIDLLESLDPPIREAIVTMVETDPARLREWSRTRHPMPGMLSVVQARELAAVTTPGGPRLLETTESCSRSLNA